MKPIELYHSCREHGIGLSGLAALEVIIEEPRLMTLVATALDVKAAYVTEIADQLEKSGLAERKRSHSDRRQIKLSPTMHGREIYDQIISAGTREK